jgi:hypothetical protein
MVHSSEERLVEGRHRHNEHISIAAALLTVGAPRAARLEDSDLPFSEELAKLGDQIFDDENLSINRNQGCNACHSSVWGFTGPDPNINAHGSVYEGSIPGRFGDRKPPSSAYSTLSPVFAFLSHDRGGLFGGRKLLGRARDRREARRRSRRSGPTSLPQLRRAGAPRLGLRRLSGFGGELRRPLQGVWGNPIDTIQFPADIDALISLWTVSTYASSFRVNLRQERRQDLRSADAAEQQCGESATLLRARYPVPRVAATRIGS